MWLVVNKILTRRSSFCNQIFHIKILASLLLKYRISLHISLFYPVGFICFCVCFLYEIKGAVKVDRLIGE